MNIDIEQLKQQCPLPRLMAHLGMEKYAVKSCKSPFRDEEHASFGIYESRGLYYWKDFGTDENGDEISFLAKHLGLEEKQNFPLLAQVYERIAAECKPTAKLAVIKAETKPTRLDKTPYVVGTDEQLKLLAQLRGIGLDGLQWASERGVLLFGQWHDYEVYAVTDRSDKVLEIRRLDGELFPAYRDLTERKSHAVAGSIKSWPVGLLEAEQYPQIGLVEGLPDFLAAHDMILMKEAETGRKSTCAPVAMLGSTAQIPEEVLAQFRGKDVVIYPHVDQAGVDAARKWKLQLTGKAKSVHLYDLSKYAAENDVEINDVNDLVRALK